jgi:ATP-dependent exoDNAse (exonuclease V) alpha subunit
VHEEARKLDIAEDVRARVLGLDASTLHRLLGWRPDSHSRFRHDRGNRLPYDVVIVDETSMVVALADGPADRGGAAPTRGWSWSATRGS